MTDLSEKQRKHLRRLAHPLHPLVLIGNAGLTDAVVAELDGALGAHELVKVSARIDARVEREAALEALATRTKAHLVQRVGKIGLFYRARALPRIVLPDA
jgi:RNA-binding protein